MGPLAAAYIEIIRIHREVNRTTRLSLVTFLSFTLRGSYKIAAFLSLTEPILPAIRQPGGIFILFTYPTYCSRLGNQM
ncbi:hypothetical protein PGTUg99_013537 [Puccinia graminis f. sp. tritici]|uniref:Uncharacterized protein n=1 Tax=Puccinia graminis f. sp. tritici TaxID=56615 RepID=A0A5B0Q410_PUCGR|nr:hypothetical protein PGTUg99_013537 [Puccinia graminis f. sp. tritici]